MTTTAIVFTGDFKLAGGIRNLYNKMHMQDVWSTNTLEKKQCFAKDLLILQYTKKKLSNIQGDYIKVCHSW